jgi:hypothetical protein
VDHGVDDFSLGDRVRFVHAEAAHAARTKGGHLEGEIVSINRDLATLDVNLKLTHLGWPQRLTVRPWELEKVSSSRS